jgi:tetratricopeptide (TPR) repeat protein
MLPRHVPMIRAAFAMLLLFHLPMALSWSQSPADEPAPPASPAASPIASLGIASLGLDPPQSSTLQHAIDVRDYSTAEKLLLDEINRDPHSERAARLLAYAGSVYFLNRDYLSAAVAWKKSEAIAPLDPRLRFSLAMAYIQIARPDWARPVLESLAAGDPKQALYPYWLGRLDYDGHKYPEATRHFQHAIELDPRMARAYDNLGLCYYYQNQNDLAVENYKKAIDLDRGAPYPSPWPYLNLAITLQFLSRFAEAETSLRQALGIDPKFAQAHFQLGLVLEQTDRPEAAIQELREAARLDANYAEPHMAMARIYRRLGQEAAAKEEVQIYLRLRPKPTP